MFPGVGACISLPRPQVLSTSHPHLRHQIPFPRSQEFWILGKRRKRLGLWTPGSQESPAGQRGRGGAGMQRVGSHLRHLIPACPAAVLLAASPSAPQSQPRGSIEGTRRGKGILSGSQWDTQSRHPFFLYSLGSALTHGCSLSTQRYRKPRRHTHTPHPSTLSSTPHPTTGWSTPALAIFRSPQDPNIQPHSSLPKVSLHLWL